MMDRRQSEKDEEEMRKKKNQFKIEWKVIIIFIACLIITITYSSVNLTKEHEHSEHVNSEHKHSEHVYSENSREPKKYKPHFVFLSTCGLISNMRSVSLLYSIYSLYTDAVVTRLACCDRYNNIPVVQESLKVFPRCNIVYLDYKHNFNIWHAVSTWFNTSEFKEDILIVLYERTIVLRPFPIHMVKPGNPLTGEYSSGTPWSIVGSDLNKILMNRCGDICKTYSQDSSNYVAGNPYLIHKRDIKNLTNLAALYAEDLLISGKNLGESEYFAYSLAAINLQIPQQMYEPLTVTQALWLDEWNNIIEPRYSIHYCHKYVIGNWEFDDSNTKIDRLQCSMKPFELPPAVVNNLPAIEGTGVSIYTGATSWIAWTLVPMLNGAINAYKDVICHNKTTNVNTFSARN